MRSILCQMTVMNYEGLANESNLNQDTDVDSEDVHEENDNIEHDESDLSDASLTNENEVIDRSEYECDIGGLPEHKNKRKSGMILSKVCMTTLLMILEMVI